MNILEALDEAKAPRGSDLCKIGTFLRDNAAEPGIVSLTEAVEDAATYSSRRLAQVFTDLGTPMRKDTVLEHRGGTCRCSK